MARVLVTALSLFAAWSGAAMAQAEESTAGILACPSIAGDGERLACFDREIKTLAARTVAENSGAAAAEAASARAAQSQPNAATVARLAEKEFGAEDLDKTLSERRAEQKAEGNPSELRAAVIESGENAYGQVFLVLDNGQVWRQLDSDNTMLRIPRGVDATVTIKRSFLGSYLLTVDQLGRTMRARRIK